MRKAAKMICAGVAIASLSVSAFAAGGYTKQATLEYDNIKIQIDGQQITPKDPNGKTVEPFVINGTTYLPVRAVADAVGYGVSWDGKTNTVKLSSNGSTDVPAGPTTEVGPVLFDQGGIKITYNGWTSEQTYSGGNDYAIKLLIENYTNRNICVQVRNESIDGIMCGSIFSAEVASGKKKNDTIKFMDYSINQSGITNFDNIEFYFHVFDNDNWVEYFDTGIVTINT